MRYKDSHSVVTNGTGVHRELFPRAWGAIAPETLQRGPQGRKPKEHPGTTMRPVVTLLGPRF